MPTYEFRCPDGHEFERFYRKMSDATPEVACPVCGKLAVRLLSGGAGLHFKGSGFYLTDYGKNAHRKAEPGSSEGTGRESKSGEAAREAKTSDAKGGDAKPAEAKGSDAKSAQPSASKTSDAKSSSSGKSTSSDK